MINPNKAASELQYPIISSRFINWRGSDIALCYYKSDKNHKWEDLWKENFVTMIEKYMKHPLKISTGPTNLL